MVLIFFHRKTAALVIKTLSGKLYCSINERIYGLEEIPQHEVQSRYFNLKQEKQSPKKRGKFHSSNGSPLEKDNFMKFVKAMEGREEDWGA